MEQTPENKKNTWKIVRRILIGLVLFLLTALLAICIYVYSKFSKLGTDVEEFEKFEEEEILINEELEEEVGVGYTNFVLFGADSRDNDVDNDLNTDTIIVVSLNNATNEIKLLSVYRDTLLDLTDGNIQKCNSAYRRGGAKQAINMLNMNLDLNIQKYVTVNFSVVSDVIDMLGGVEVDVSEAEMKAVNKYLAETAKVAGKKAVFLTESGLQTLDGVQATTYARIRKGVGNDYARTERQRELITLTLQKAMEADLLTINNIIDVVFPNIATNFTLTDILQYAKKLTKYSIIDSSGFPFDKGDGMVSKRGSCVYAITLESNVQKLHAFLYETENYQPTTKVVQISQEIEHILTGTSGNNNITKDDYPSKDNTSTKGDSVTVTPTPTEEITPVVTQEPSSENPPTETPLPGEEEPSEVISPTPSEEPDSGSEILPPEDDTPETEEPVPGSGDTTDGDSSAGETTPPAEAPGESTGMEEQNPADVQENSSEVTQTTAQEETT